MADPTGTLNARPGDSTNLLLRKILLNLADLPGTFLPVAGGTLTGSLYLASGTGSTPGIAFATGPTTGFKPFGTTGWTFYSAGTGSLVFGGGGTINDPTTGSSISFPGTGPNAGAVFISAAGTNKSITLTPSGSGNVSVSSAGNAYFAANSSVDNKLAGFRFRVGPTTSVDWEIDAGGFTSAAVSEQGTLFFYDNKGSGYRLILGKQSKPAWGVVGANVTFPSATFTDGTSSGTVASAVSASLAIPTFAATNATTFTDAANLYIAGDVAAGTNVTLTNSYGLWNVGKTRLDGAVVLPSTNTAGIQLYNTADQTTNYERLEMVWSGNVSYIRNVVGGSGTSRVLAIGVGNRQVFFRQLSVPFIEFATGTTSATGEFFRFTPISTATSGPNAMLSITPTYNQASGTAANTDLLINRTQTAVGSGAQLLIDAQVGSVSKFSVNNAGAIACGNTVAAGVGVASTHKVTISIGGNTYYLLASNV